MKFPKTIGECIDLLYKYRLERHTFQAKADAVKEKEGELSKYIMDHFKKTELDGARGKLATATISPTTVGNVKDWNKLYAYIVKNKAFDMLQRRLNDKAYRERLDDKKAVPGVEPFIANKLSLTKSNKRSK